MRCSLVRHSVCTLLLGMLPMVANGAAVPFGPTPYLETGDTPTDFFSTDCELHLEDFEDGAVDAFLTISPGDPLHPNFVSGSGVPLTDSVDGDDGTVDGSGLDGWSFFTEGEELTIEFASAVTSAGLVFTDGDSRLTDVRLEAFSGTTSLGVIHAGDIADDVYTGTTAEDRFLGFLDVDGITSLHLSINAGSGIEIDHVQWQHCVPEPASLGLATFAVLGLVGLRRRRR